MFSSLCNGVLTSGPLESMDMYPTSDRDAIEDALRQANRRKDEFLALLAHELRNPLAPMRNAIQILRRSDGDPHVLSKLSDMLERQVGQMIRLVDDLLDVSRIASGKIELRKQRIELATVIEQAVEAARSIAQHENHELCVTLPSRSMVLYADASRLAQVIGNLLSNACKFMHQGGRIELIVEADGDQAVVRVKDRGIGIEPDKIAGIFDMFVQIDSSLERMRSGLGLGLALVKSLVEMHDGTIMAHSDGLGFGSEFVIYLPLVMQSAETAQRLSAQDQSNGVGRRILIVDDNDDGAKTLAMTLELSGHDALTASDGAEGMRIAQIFQPEVMIIDIGLPGINGYEVGRRMRAQAWSRDMVFIAVTGWGQEEDRHKSKAAGFDHHLLKPLDFGVLEGLLRSFTGPQDETRLRARDPTDEWQALVTAESKMESISLAIG